MKLSKVLSLLPIIFTIISCSSTPSSEMSLNSSNITNTSNDSSYKYKYYDNSDSFTAGAVKLSFNSAGNYEYLKGIDGKKVALKGFMFSASPIDGSFIFLSNMPYQSCPFCALNTSELSNCFEIYPKKNNKFSLTESAICIVGTLKVAPSAKEPFTDKYGYEFLSKIEDGDLKIIENVEDEGDFTLRNAFAGTNLLTDLYSMLNYVYFVCNWPDFYVNTWEDKNGEIHTGYFLYAADALRYIKDEGAQWNYGYQDGYFDNFIKEINKISETGFETLIEIINKCKQVAEYAISELEAGHYTYSLQYVEMFDTEDYIYTMNDKTLVTKPDELYNEFSYWLTSFEM